MTGSVEVVLSLVSIVSVTGSVEVVLSPVSTGSEVVVSTDSGCRSSNWNDTVASGMMINSVEVALSPVSTGSVDGSVVVS